MGGGGLDFRRILNDEYVNKPPILNDNDGTTIQGLNKYLRTFK